ncbi:hypothetical protein FACS1894201_10880 [Bacteroidia bacterium]|nr:hypothetical protein FACS1894201_10880 [Bacteroidia bacterium]
MKKLICISAFLWLSMCLTAQNNVFTWNGKIVDKNNENIPNVHVQLNANGKIFLFTSNTEGIVEIMYGNSQDTDSIIISSMGYKTVRTTIRQVDKFSAIQLEDESIVLSEVTIRPQNVQQVTMGNLSKLNHNIGILPTQKRALYVSNHKKLKGSIIAVRICMLKFKKSFMEEGAERMPFRLRLYDGKSFFKDEITTDTLIAAMKETDQNWVTIDLSSFHYTMPQDGLYVVIEMLPIEFYLKHGYLKQQFVKGRFSPTLDGGESYLADIPNAIFIGTTKPTSFNSSLRGYGYTPLEVMKYCDSIWGQVPGYIPHDTARIDKWNELKNNRRRPNMPLIQLEVEIKK